jgi:hypothetical protein
MFGETNIFAQKLFDKIRRNLVTDSESVIPMILRMTFVLDDDDDDDGETLRTEMFQMNHG